MLGYPEDMKGYRVWHIRKKQIVVSRNVQFFEDSFPFRGEKKLFLPNTSTLESSDDDEIGFSDFPTPEDNLPVEDPGSREPDEKGNPVPEEAVSVPGETTPDSGEAAPVQGEAVPVPGESIPVPGEAAQRWTTTTEDQRFDTVQRERAGYPVRIRREKKVCTMPYCRIATSSTTEEIDEVQVPKTAKEALTGPYAELWKKAMEEEFNSLHQKGTWEIVRKTPEMINVVGSRWVFSLKRNNFGEIVRFKARLVAQGFTQVAGVDFTETFSPVLMKRSLRILIALTVENDWEMDQVDVITAYLNSPLDITVYMRQPPYFETANKSTHVCKLIKSLYGLKQSGRNWNNFLHDCLLKMGCNHCKDSDPCVYVKGDLIIGVYVDDMIIIGTRESIDECKRELTARLQIKDMGSVSVILSHRIKRLNREQVSVDQTLYAKNVIKEFDMSSCHGVCTPLEKHDGTREEPDESNGFDNTMYRKGIGCLLYLSTNTRPDLAYAVGKLSQRCEKPTKYDWECVQHVLKYLQKTKDYALNFHRTGKQVEAWVDADWASDFSTAKSVTGYVIILAGGAISWKSSKQSCVASSTTHAEYMALYEVVTELLWLRIFLTELGQSRFVNGPMTIHADNMGAIKLAEYTRFTERSKHFNVKFHFTREQLKNRMIRLEHTRSDENLADLFTKPLNGVRTKELSALFGVKRTPYQ